MEAINYVIQNKQIKEFESALFDLDNDHDKIRESYQIGFEGPYYRRIPVFFFKDDTKLNRGEREVCYDLFIEYFPYGKVGSL
jgi:hypothetical protein